MLRINHRVKDELCLITVFCASFLLKLAAHTLDLSLIEHHLLWTYNKSSLINRAYSELKDPAVLRR